MAEIVKEEPFDKSEYYDEEGNVIREKSLAEVQQEVGQELTRKKYMDAYQAMIEKMLLTEDVQFFESRVQ